MTSWTPGDDDPAVDPWCVAVWTVLLGGCAAFWAGVGMLLAGCG